MTEQQLKFKINELIAYAIDNLSLKADDECYILNQLLDFFRLQSPGEPIDKYGDFQTIVDSLVDYAIDNKLTLTDDRILVETKILGFVTPVPSQIIEEFDRLVSNKGVKFATDWLFEISKASNYIRLPDIAKNIKWNHKGAFGDIEITINLSKPEKDPKQIALAKLQPKSNYPSCMLCQTNVGYAGHMNHPARQTLRTIPLELGNEPWSLQFSPYQYYDQHIIAFSQEHKPMDVTPESLQRLLDFVEIFPHYFIGSNAALPIVGGSILTHDHYQGGNKVLPMFKVAERAIYSDSQMPDIKVSIIDWYNSVVRVSGKNKSEVHSMATKVLKTWQDWTDESVGIFCKTTEQHNAITPIARLENNVYIVDMILRNNRTDDAHPFGIFHPEEYLHNIKKEGIGIIEVMGLFILPGRLKSELETIKQYLSGEITLNLKEISSDDHPMCKHAQMILQLVNDNGAQNARSKSEKIITDYVNKACEEILECTAVYKNNELGQLGFRNFMTNALGLKEC